jgi:hypothetical protein
LEPQGNPENACIAILLSLLDGKYSLPLQRVARPFHHAHYACFDDARRLCPDAVGPALDELRKTVLREVGPDEPPPLQIHPALVVVKDSEVLAALQALAAVDRPFSEDVQVRVGDKSALLGILTHLDALNSTLLLSRPNLPETPTSPSSSRKSSCASARTWASGMICCLTSRLHTLQWQTPWQYGQGVDCDHRQREHGLCHQ